VRSGNKAGRFLADDVRIGHINGVFGLRGEVRLYLYNPVTDLLGTRLEVVLVAPDGARRPVEIDVRPGSGRRILGRIQGISTPEAAASMKDHELVVLEAELPEPDLGEWYHRDLIGTPVVTDAGDALGRIREIVTGPGMDTWVVLGPGGSVWIHARNEDLVEVQLPDRIVVRAAAVLRV
jgi:16S rRNA processing protein RimM